MIENIVFITIFILFLTCAFHGLLGAIHKHLRLPTRLNNPGGFPLKTYVDRKAVYWGTATFFAMATLPLISAIAIIEERYDTQVAYSALIVSSVIAFLLATLIRKTWVFQHPK